MLLPVLPLAVFQSEMFSSREQSVVPDVTHHALEEGHLGAVEFFQMRL